MDNSTKKNGSSNGQPAICGCCLVEISGNCYKCRSCYDFNYCSDCFREASLIHPGHEFNLVQGVPISEISGNELNPPQGTLDYDSKAKQHCTSCDSLAAHMPLFRHYQHDSDNEKKHEEQDQNDQRPENAAESILNSLHPSTLTNSSTPGSEGDESSRPLKKSSTPFVILWDVRISKLVEATQRGCMFCGFILDRFYNALGGGNIQFVSFYGSSNGDPKWYLRPEEESKDRDDAVWKCMEALSQLKQDRFRLLVHPFSSGIEVKFPDYDKLQFALYDAGDDDELLSQVFSSNENIIQSGRRLPGIDFELRVFTTHDDPAADHISGRPPTAYPRSERSLDLIRYWTNECSQNHGGSCVRDTDIQTALPRRAIDVGDGKSLKLYERSPGEKGRYITLSYCWGGSQAFQTTKSTFDAMKSGFSIADLPKTMQDAIFITHALGVKYIWIDCLCIIQDEPLDKSYEFSQMGNIYKNSYLTISASRAKSVDQGFLIDEADETTGLWMGLIPLNYRVPDKSAVTVSQALSSPALKGKLWLFEDLPMWKEFGVLITSSRGWCLQEQFLSPRLLSYGRWPTWRCRKSTWSDGGYYYSPSFMRDDSDELEREFVHMMFDLAPSTLDASSAYRLHQAWYGVVHDYSRRSIGRENDILPAIAGIAAEMAKLTRYRYLAGLWGKTLLYDLMWFTSEREWIHRPVQWRAPSWSWASVESPIMYDKMAPGSKPLARVIQCEVIEKDPLSPFGEVSAASIEIRGLFSLLKSENVNEIFARQSLTASPPKGPASFNEWVANVFRTTPMAMRSSRVKVNLENRSLLQGPVYGLIMFSIGGILKKDGHQTDVTCYSGLFLQKEYDSSGRFKRVGSFINEFQSWLDQSSEPWKEEVVVIV